MGGPPTAVGVRKKSYSVVVTLSTRSSANADGTVRARTL